MAHFFRLVVRVSLSIAVVLALPGVSAQTQEEVTKAFKDLLSLKTVGGPRISPDGSSIAYSVTSTDWEDNRSDSEIWLKLPGEEPFQLTRTEKGSSSGPRWSPDGAWLAFTADRGEKRQIYVINPLGGEANQLTSSETPAGSFQWSPAGDRIAFTTTDAETGAMEQRSKEYGGFAVEDADFRMSHLWVVDVQPGAGAEAQRLTEGEFTVGSFNWSPDGTRIAFDHRPTPQVDSFPLADISIVNVASRRVSSLVASPGPDSGPNWSPDGSTILFGTSAGANAYYGNRELATIPAGGGDVTVLTSDFDENPGVVAWNNSGIWFTASQRTARRLYLLDPQSGRIEGKTFDPEMIGAAHISADGRSIAFSAESRTRVAEIYRADLYNLRPERITDMHAQVADWQLGTREVIQWKSSDGAEIEGVLFKPADFDSSLRYPLLVAIHGGPTGTSRPQAVPRGVYPVLEWLKKGAVVLMPNYRGSAGYGADFRALNVRNLGVGDAWDVLSGADALIERGIADPDRMGAMGWSQGGYISAFLTTNTDRFKAISVGAGISNWMTYYVNTDIHGFTRNYLKANPWDDPEIYAKTSPMTNIKEASTPTLIQHGEFDRRVPTPNAYELYQGLQDVGVETRLVIYKGFGHGITKPKERLAALWHNWQWFARYIWGEEVELPVDLPTEEETVEQSAERAEP